MIKRILYFGNGAWVDIDGLTVYRPPQAQVHLGVAAYQVLLALVAARGNLVSTEALRAQVSSPAHAVEELRRAIGDEGRPYQCIWTVPTLGYKLINFRLEVRQLGENEPFCLGPTDPGFSQPPSSDGANASHEVAIEYPAP